MLPLADCVYGRLEGIRDLFGLLLSEEIPDDRQATKESD